MNLLLAQTDAAMAGQGAASMISLVVMVVFWFGIMYFLMIRPQRKEQKKKQRFPLFAFTQIHRLS